MELSILYQDEHLVAVNKPAGLIVHPHRRARGEPSCLKVLRDQIGQYLYPIHRLDRNTSGVILFALNKEAAGRVCQQIQRREVKKKYVTLVRGYLEDQGMIDRPLQDDEQKEPVAAVTAYRTLARVELPWAVSRYPTSRYSLLEVSPETGRFHQIRRHFKSISHPLIGDTWYGDGKHNRLFREKYGVERMLLSAVEFEVAHPVSNARLCVRAPLPDDFQRLNELLGWKDLPL